MNTAFNIFGFEPLQNLNLGTSKLLNEYPLKFLGSNCLMRNSGLVVEQGLPISRMRVIVLCGVDALLTAVTRKADVPGLYEDFFSKSFFTQSSIFFLINGVCRMLEGKDYCAVDLIFPIIRANFDATTRFQNEANMTSVHRTYSKIVSDVLSEN